MTKFLTIFFLFFCSLSFAQETIKTNTVKIIDKGETILKVDVTFVYYPTGFTLICSDRRIYTYLVPGTEFYDIDNVTFIDTGVLLKDSVQFSTEYPIVIYKSTIKNVEIAQQIDSVSIFLMKRNSTGIKFYKE